MGIEDNDWVELFNDNGVFVQRCAVSARIPEGTVFVVPRHRAHHQCPEVAAARQTGGHEQLADPHPPEAAADGSAVTPSSPILQLLGADRRQPRHARVSQKVEGVSCNERTSTTGMVFTSGQVHRLPHLLSIACKNIWTDRKGAEYMWWNNVETRPGVGYPTQWENQEHFGRLGVRPGLRRGAPNEARGCTASSAGWRNSTSTPICPAWKTTTSRSPSATPTCSKRPRATTSRPPSQSRRSTGKPMHIESGPNWDDDLGGSQLYARNDPNRQNLR